jgi:glycolate oxidase iron-sulfur subunit
VICPPFQKLLAHNLERFEAGEFDVLVTACATCTSTIHEMWPKMADDSHREAAARLARRTMDINQFLIKGRHLQPLTGSAGTLRTSPTTTRAT